MPWLRWYRNVDSVFEDRVKAPIRSAEVLETAIDRYAFSQEAFAKLSSMYVQQRKESAEA